MRKITIFCFFLLAAQAVAAQSDVLSISSQASVELPADIIRFNINLNAGADSPRSAYTLHKKRERTLVQLLEKYQVQEKNITFEPVSIHKDRNTNRYDQEGPAKYQTRQMVSLRLPDFEVYEKIQLALIEHGFDNFSGNFLSANVEQGKERALKNAIRQAKEKARFIARESGIRLGKIIRIHYNHGQNGPVYARKMDMAFEASSSKLLKYDQRVTITSQITIEFAILN